MPGLTLVAQLRPHGGPCILAPCPRRGVVGPTLGSYSSRWKTGRSAHRQPHVPGTGRRAPRPLAFSRLLRAAPSRARPAARAREGQRRGGRRSPGGSLPGFLHPRRGSGLQDRQEALFGRIKKEKIFRGIVFAS